MKYALLALLLCLPLSDAFAEPPAPAATAPATGPSPEVMGRMFNVVGAQRNRVAIDNLNAEADGDMLRLQMSDLQKALDATKQQLADAQTKAADALKQAADAQKALADYKAAHPEPAPAAP